MASGAPPCCAITTPASGGPEHSLCALCAPPLPRGTGLLSGSAPPAPLLPCPVQGPGCNHTASSLWRLASITWRNVFAARRPGAVLPRPGREALAEGRSPGGGCVRRGGAPLGQARGGRIVEQAVWLGRERGGGPPEGGQLWPGSSWSSKQGWGSALPGVDGLTLCCFPGVQGVRGRPQEHRQCLD